MLAARQQPNSVMQTGRLLQVCQLVVWIEDVDETYALLMEKGVPGISGPHDILSTLRAAWVMDPDGNPVEIVSRRVVQQESQAGE